MSNVIHSIGHYAVLVGLWFAVLSVVAWIACVLFGIPRAIANLASKPEINVTNIEQTAYMMYRNQGDPTTPEYGATRNEHQRRGQ